MSLEQFDEIHRIYIRATELAERLLEHPRFRYVATDPITGELLGQINTVAHAAATLKILTGTRLPPALQQIWREVLDAQPHVESTRDQSTS